MDLVRWEPFDGLTKMQSRINALFDEVFDRANGHLQPYSGGWSLRWTFWRAVIPI